VFGFEVLRSGCITKSCVIPNMTEQGYFYIPLSDGAHGRTTRVWINRKAIVQKKEKDKVIYQINDWLTYKVTQKGNVVLLPRDDKNETIIHLFATCGYRGTSKIDIKHGKKVIICSHYHSARGALGISQHGLFLVRDGTIFTIERTGRLYGAPEVITAKIVFAPNGIDLIETQEESDKELMQML